MDADKTTTAAVSQPGDNVPNESHYHSKKDRVFVRGIQGTYNLKTELAQTDCSRFVLMSETGRKSDLRLMTDQRPLKILIYSLTMPVMHMVWT